MGIDVWSIFYYSLYFTKLLKTVRFYIRLLDCSSIRTFMLHKVLSFKSLHINRKLRPLLLPFEFVIARKLEIITNNFFSLCIIRHKNAGSYDCTI